VIQALMAAQEQNGGWLTDELMAAVAKYLDLPPVWAYEVATFYSMFDLKPVGKHKVAICTNISCWLNGAEDLVRHAEKKLGCKHGGTSPDGRITLKVEEECLAACAGAPMMVIDGHYHELTPRRGSCWTAEVMGGHHHYSEGTARRPRVGGPAWSTTLHFDKPGLAETT
jgi:NADH-quinone oxidoreductase subunit E